MECWEVAAADGASLKAYRWQGDVTPRGIVQIAHGAAEHLRRYDPLARFLMAGGYALVGADHRGHGANIAADGPGEFGPRGFAGLVDDMRAVAVAAKTRWPNTPLVLLGHSMGSFAAQAFIADHAALIDGAVLSGTTAIELLFAQNSSSGGLADCNRAFEPARTPFDWLSRDEAAVDAYINDPLCGFELAPSSVATMPAVLADVRSVSRLRPAIARNLPVLIITGENDPIVGPGQSGARAVAQDYRHAGLTDVSHIIYPGGRHEMFNEINSDAVLRDLGEWLYARS